MTLVLRSRHSLIVLVVAAVAYAIGAAFASVAWATLTEKGSAHYANLYRSGEWLQLAAFCGVAIAVVLAGWSAIRSSLGDREDTVEITAGALIPLLAASGYGLMAARSPYDASGHLLLAIGVGLWAPLGLGYGAHHNAASRRGETGTRHLGPLWSAASLGLVIYAIGLYPVAVGDHAERSGVLSGSLRFIGASLVAYALIAARRRALLSPRSTGIVAAGVTVLAATAIALVIVSHLELGSSATFTGVKAGYALVSAGTALAVLTLGIGAAVQAVQVGRTLRSSDDLRLTPSSTSQEGTVR